MSALTRLKDRLAELTDLEALGRLAGWDQRTMMPAGGGAGRAAQLATLERLSHERATADEVGEWLAELDGADGLDELDRDVVRLARRDFERARRVPVDLAAELAMAGAEGQDAWQAARAANDFGAFAPVLRRNVELARAYAGCFADETPAPYDALLADYDFGLTAAKIAPVFDELTATLPDLAREAAAGPGPDHLEVPVEAQRTAVERALRRVGVDDETWRVDVSAHPFTSWVGARDIRLTTRYDDGRLESVLAALHEFGHGLYEHQIPAELTRTNLGHGTSMSVHESQSKLWENHVARHPAFAHVLAEDLGAGGFDITPEALHRALNDVRPSLIRVSADPLTYPLHIVLRFELERALVEGRLDVVDLPVAWNDGMKRLLGIDVPDDASGVLQDVHWSAGAFGYFPSYALGCLIAAQLWERLEEDLGPQDDALRAGEAGAIRDWLRERVHRHGRRLDTEGVVEHAVGRGLDAGPFVRHVTALVAA